MSTDYKILDDEELVALIKLDMGKEDLASALIKSKYLNKKTVDLEGLAITAKIYAQLGLFEKAKVYYASYLKKEEGAVTERFQLGMVMLDSGEADAAMQQWESVLEQEPAHPPTLFYKGLALANDKKFAEAQQCLTILLQSAPSDNLYFGRAKQLLDNLGKEAVINEESSSSNALTADAYRSIN